MTKPVDPSTSSPGPVLPPQQPTDPQQKDSSETSPLRMWDGKRISSLNKKERKEFIAIIKEAKKNGMLTKNGELHMSDAQLLRTAMRHKKVHDRIVQHNTAPDRAIHLLALQKQREASDVETPSLDKHAQSPVLPPQGSLKPLNTLGEGATAKVESVVHGQAGPIAARKVAASSMNEDTLEAFQHEEQVLRSLSHPNIVKVQGSSLSETDEAPYIQMEHGGGTLKQVIEGDGEKGPKPFMLFGIHDDVTRKYEYQSENSSQPPEVVKRKYGGALPPAMNRKIMEQVLSALVYLDKENVAHRDIKPGNILIDATGHVRLADFDVAQRLQDGETLDYAAGTLAYLAPEVMAMMVSGGQEDVDCDTRADIFSAGVVFYQLLTGNKYLRLKGDEITSALKTELLLLSERDPLHWLDSVADFGEFAIEPENQFPMAKLLAGMLQVDPDQRLSPEQALTMLKNMSSPAEGTDM